MQDDVDLANDPRWRRLWAKPWICSGCEQTHHGLIDLASAMPAYWRGPEEKAPNGALDLGGNFLSDDFCVIEAEHFFVRAVLELPIQGSGGEHFGFGVWSTLSRENFERYVATFDSGDQGELGPWFGWFSSNLKGYPETLNIKCQVRPRNARQRPFILLEPTAHPLAVEQRQGIALDRVLDLYEINGHDIRASLSD